MTLVSTTITRGPQRSSCREPFAAGLASRKECRFEAHDRRAVQAASMRLGRRLEPRVDLFRNVFQGQVHGDFRACEMEAQPWHNNHFWCHKGSCLGRRDLPLRSPIYPAKMLIPGRAANLRSNIMIVEMPCRFHVVASDGHDFVHESEDQAQSGLNRIPAVDRGVAVQNLLQHFGVGHRALARGHRPLEHPPTTSPRSLSPRIEAMSPDGKS